MEHNFVQKGGDLVMESCASSNRGGCLHVAGHFHQQATAFARFKSCQALRGGCASVVESMKVSGLNSFDGCTASGEGGGGLYVQRNFSQHGGTVNFTGCQTLINGGGLQVEGNLTAHAGNMTFKSCKAGVAGGGVDAGENVLALANASVVFNECMAGEHGGGLGSQKLFYRAYFGSCLETMHERYVPVPRQPFPAWCKYSFPRLRSACWIWRRLGGIQRLPDATCRKHAIHSL